MRNKVQKNEKITTSSNSSSLTTAKKHLQKQIWQRPVIEVISSAKTAGSKGPGGDGGLPGGSPS